MTHGWTAQLHRLHQCLSPVQSFSLGRERSSSRSETTNRAILRTGQAGCVGEFLVRELAISISAASPSPEHPD